MRNDRIRNLLHAVLCLLLAGRASGDVLSYGSYLFSDSSSTVAIPQFDPSLGTLNSVTFSITDYSMNETFIRDVDDTDGPLNVSELHRNWGVYAGQPLTDPVSIEVYRINQIVSGSSLSDDDGDRLAGPMTRDGGDDEIVWNISYPSSGGVSADQTSQSILSFFTGMGTVSLGAGPASPTTWTPATTRITEDFSDVVAFSGNLSVSYGYSVIPEPGTFFLLVLGGAAAWLSTLVHKLANVFIGKGDSSLRSE